MVAPTMAFGAFNCYYRRPMTDVKQQTRRAFLWGQLLNAPFWGLYGLLSFILYKDLGATPLELAVFVTLKPAVSLISLYWSAPVHQRPDRLRSNMLWGGLLARLPFFFTPFVHSSWLLIAAAAFYLMLNRAVVPAWMEIMRRNMCTDGHSSAVAHGSTISYLGGLLLPCVMAPWMDMTAEAWRWLCPMLTLVSCLGLLFQLRLPILGDVPVAAIKSYRGLIEPWREAVLLLKLRPDFARYQLGFFLGGAGLMLLQPALPQIYVDQLRLSYTELALAIAACKGVGFAVASPFWKRWLPNARFFRPVALVTFLASLFPLILLGAQLHCAWLYVAYLGYGIMQAGSELYWHLTGPIFSEKEDSTIYSSVNVAAVGVRGAVFPVLGSLICSLWNPATALLFGSLLCLGGTGILLLRQRAISGQSI
jgi:hypothetical protein